MLPPAQQIDLDIGTVERLGAGGAAEGSTEEGSGGAEPSPAAPEEAHRAEVERRAADLRPKSSPAVIAFFRKAQERRVVVYASFEHTLAAMLASGRFDSYPSECAAVTKEFASLSADARAAIAVLEQRGAGPAAESASRVQARALR